VPQTPTEEKEDDAEPPDADLVQIFDDLEPPVDTPFSIVETPADEPTRIVIATNETGVAPPPEPKAEGYRPWSELPRQSIFGTAPLPTLTEIYDAAEADHAPRTVEPPPSKKPKVRVVYEAAEEPKNQPGSSSQQKACPGKPRAEPKTSPEPTGKRLPWPEVFNHAANAHLTDHEERCLIARRRLYGLTKEMEAEMVTQAQLRELHADQFCTAREKAIASIPVLATLYAQHEYDSESLDDPLPQWREKWVTVLAAGAMAGAKCLEDQDEHARLANTEWTSVQQANDAWTSIYTRLKRKDTEVLNQSRLAGEDREQLNMFLADAAVKLGTTVSDIVLKQMSKIQCLHSLSSRQRWSFS